MLSVCSVILILVLLFDKPEHPENLVKSTHSILLVV